VPVVFSFLCDVSVLTSFINCFIQVWFEKSNLLPVILPFQTKLDDNLLATFKY